MIPQPPLVPAPYDPHWFYQTEMDTAEEEGGDLEENLEESL